MKITLRLFAAASLMLLGLFEILSEPQARMFDIMGGIMIGVAFVFVLMEIDDALVEVDE